MERIREKLAALDEYVVEYCSIAPEDFTEYSRDLRNIAAAERYFEKIVECATDVAFLVIKKFKLEIPEDDLGAFDVLAKTGFLSKSTCESMKEAKAMRNRLVHQYADVSNEMVFESLTKELPKDVKKFKKEIEEKI